MIAAGARQIEEGLRAGQGEGMAALLPGLDRDIRAAMDAVDRLDGTAARPAPQAPAGAAERAGVSDGQVIDLAAVTAARDLLRDQIGRQSLSARRSFQSFAEAVGMSVDERDTDPDRGCADAARLRRSADASGCVLRRTRSWPEGYLSMSGKPVIMIVDDEIANIELMGAVLEEEYEIVFARSGEQAIELARKAPLDLILLDVVMPGLDGYETCRRIKQVSATGRCADHLHDRARFHTNMRSRACRRGQSTM